MKTLSSYLAGKWVKGNGSPRQLVNPTTEEVLAETSTAGLDLAGGLAHARSHGVAALQELTFAQRGALLMATSKALHAYRDELIALSTESGGNTRGDAKFDVDGAIGTLAFYSTLGESLGDKRNLIDGDGLQLGRTPRYWGEHMLTSRRGVAVHINAFNFPAWGTFEKAAVALLAGMPVISKPATSTAILAHRMTEILVEAAVLPEGAFSLVCGSPGDLLDHLDHQDVLAFTGGSNTAITLRQHDAFVRRGARLNVEADSLNAAVLGRDVDSDSVTFELFVQDVVRDMTQKAGQKCTAIRRVFVPEGSVDAAREALSERLTENAVGDPAQKGVRVGPLATAGQLRDVKAGIERLKGCCEAVPGDGGRGELRGVDGDKGFFVSPTLFVAKDARAEDVHAHEVFGPVATILPYSGDPAEAAELVALGKGGLVASVYTDKVDVATGVALGIAPYSGRVNIGSAKVADHSMGPGAVLPQLVHGGPGRAGGGEELGGLRGLSFYMQRTALQGYKPLLEKVLADAKRV